MPDPLLLVVALIPLLPLVTAVATARVTPAAVPAATRRCVTLTVVLAVVAAVGLLARGAPIVGHVGDAGSPWHVAVAFDGVAAGMVLLIAFLGWVIGQFATRYLAADTHEARFHRHLLFALAAVLSLVLAGNLPLFFAAWVGSSAALHALLRYDPARPAACLAARKKFVISRLGDLCLAAAGWLLWRAYHTWDFGALFQAVAAAPGGVEIPACLLAAGAAIKSAQVPFHWWLPDTMETPTPVSALMHAGIINAGGFLVIRLSPLFVHAPAALTLLACIGGLTAGYGAVVMLTQPTVKRALAYSTIAQMGFMLLECGLGAFGLAFLHLLAHSLYKAHAFLLSGSTVGAIPRAAVPLRRAALVAGGFAAAVISAGTWALTSASWGDIVFLVALFLALAYGLARAWSVLPHGQFWAMPAAAAVAFAAATTALHHAAEALIPSGPAPAPAVVVAISALFFGLFAIQTLVAHAHRHAWSRRLYVHALNGFYFGTWAQRLFVRA